VTRWHDLPGVVGVDTGLGGSTERVKVPYIDPGLPFWTTRGGGWMLIES
jgi:hypothetical protein